MVLKCLKQSHSEQEYISKFSSWGKQTWKKNAQFGVLFILHKCYLLPQEGKGKKDTKDNVDYTYTHIYVFYERRGKNLLKY